MRSDTPISRSAAEVSDEGAKAALRHLLDDPEFKATERNRRFIEFVCEEKLAGRAGAIKAYSIAVDVFGRSENFDASTDPIVRIEATRLRASLTRYYELEGRGCGIRIDLPKGGYIPAFVQAKGEELGKEPIGEGSLGEACDAIEPDEPFVQAAEPLPEVLPVGSGIEAAGAASRRRHLYRAAVALAVATGIACVLLFGIVPVLENPVISSRPIVSLSVTAADAARAPQADLFHDALLTAISQFQTVRVVSGDHPTTEGTEVGRRSAYRVIIKYAATDFDVGAWWQIVDAGTGETVQSGVERSFVNARSLAEVEARLVSAVAVEIVASRGAIATAETARELGSPSLGYGCVLRGALALQSSDKAALADSRTCLERSIEVQANDGDAKAMLALVLLKIDKPETPTILSPNALLLASQAVNLDPRSDRATAALMVARFRNGQIEAAILSGQRAMELNPNNGAIPAKLGSMLFAIGRWDEALRLVARAQAIDGAPYPEADITRAMDAYRRGDYPTALLRVKEMGDVECFCAEVLRVATLGQLGLAAEARAAAAKLKRERQGFEGDYRIAMAARHFNLAMTDNLQAGLIKAGLRMR